MNASTTNKDLTISLSRLRQMLEHEEPGVVVDVRPSTEREEWHIPGSIHFDAYDALKRNDPDALAGLELPDDEPIVTVCGAGKTSLTAAKQLRSQGKQASSLAGGMKAWSLAFNSADVSLEGTAADVVQVRRTGKGCLSYAVVSDGEALVIDAALPPDVYVELAERRGWDITHVADTHVHADHLSRSRPLAEAAGAELLLPDQQRASFPFRPLRDGDVLVIGHARLKVLRTPGHTVESTSYLLDESALFSGDTLFTDGVGRPDLEAGRQEASERAAALYESMQRLLEEIPAEAVVLPGHISRPVPFDGRAIGDSLGAVRERIDALSLPKDAFVERILKRIPPTPPNYERIVALNESGASAPDDVLDLEAGANRCAVS